MKKHIALLTAATLLFGLCACTAAQSEGQDAEEFQGPTWQEQYDLGVRYLSEGNYEEAILAFTAAIEIDPKQAPAYVGRGDAYVLSGETEEHLTAAKTDYEKAIELDEAIAEAYLGLVDVYIRQEEYEKALAILSQGVLKTGNQSLEDKLREVEEIIQQQSSQINTLATVSFTGSNYDMNLSLTIPDLPPEVWVDEDTRNFYSANFAVDISNGKYTFRVESILGGNGEPGGMRPVPGHSDFGERLWVLSGAYWGLHLASPVVVERIDNTLTWHFTMPEAGFPITDIQYISYNIKYKTSATAAPIQEGAIFSVQNDNISFLEFGYMSELGYWSPDDYDNIEAAIKN